MANEVLNAVGSGADKGGTADAGADNTLVGGGAGADKGAADKAAADKIAADAAAKGGDKVAADKIAADKIAADKVAADKITADKAAGAADWRTRLAGDDKEMLKTLARYTDEAAFGKAHRALLTRMSSGELKKALPEGATPEEVATWREENGIPKDGAGYLEKLALPQGMVIGEADKPIVAQFAEAALAGNVDPKQFSGMVAQYYKIQDLQRAAQEDADATFKQASEDALRKDWPGADYRKNLTAVSNMMAGWPEGLAAQFLAGRSPDGRKNGDNPALIKQFAALALELNPAAALVPAGTTDAGKTVDARIAEIRKFRTENPGKYEADKAMQTEELALIEAQLAMKKRNAA